MTNQDAPAGQGVGVTSALPYVLMVTAQNVDADAVLFKYADQSWGSNDQPHHCNFGKYDSGSRYVLIPWLFGPGCEEERETDALVFLGTATVDSLARRVRERLSSCFTLYSYLSVWCYVMNRRC